MAGLSPGTRARGFELWSAVTRKMKLRQKRCDACAVIFGVSKARLRFGGKGEGSSPTGLVGMIGWVVRGTEGMLGNMDPTARSLIMPPIFLKNTRHARNKGLEESINGLC